MARYAERVSRSRPGRAVAFAAVPLLAAVACGTVLSSEVDRASEDGGFEQSVDAGPDEEAAAAAPDAPPVTSFCSGRAAILCDDFDDLTQKRSSDWTAEEVVGTASLVPFTDEAASPPRSLRAVIERNGEPAHARLRRDIAFNGVSIVFSFEVAIRSLEAGAMSGNAGVVLATVTAGSQEVTLGVRLLGDYPQGEVGFSQPQAGFKAFAYPPIDGKAHRIAIEVTKYDDGLLFTLKIDGVTTLNHAFAASTTSGLSLTVGPELVFDGSSADVWVDDVLLTDN
jgi:hypothetical protein